jgi:poly(hydroxyalkanoate) granule-associated protein
MGTRKKAKAGKISAANLNIAESAQHIWLAGLGALSRAQHDGPKLFKSLVAEGARVQDKTSKVAERAIKGALANLQTSVSGRVTEVTDKAQETWDNIEKIFQTRVQKAIHQLGVPSAREINALTHKVDELTHMVESLRHARSTPRRAPATSARPKSPRSNASPQQVAGGPAA